ncbi:hypothetical protein DH2020_038706 [Rehmannia glutinosa]|uniref:AMP-dependent synthetase/ligase domain-containing protein n=1 Tax=Rehmannia glutinosa TaxID=99300 RepID=A0ABR0UZ06_REHGL
MKKRNESRFVYSAVEKNYWILPVDSLQRNDPYMVRNPHPMPETRFVHRLPRNQKEGRRFGFGPNVPAMCELHFAVPMAGAILNTVNLRLDTKAISNLLQHSGSKVVFVDCQSATLAQEALSMFPANLQRPVLVLIRDEYYEKA